MLLSCNVGEYSWESLGLQGDQTSQSSRKSVLNIHWKDWCWSWSSNTLVTWGEELSHWKRPWCWARLKVGGKGDDGGWEGWSHHWLDGCVFEQALGVSDVQVSLACFSPWGGKKLDTTEQLNWTDTVFYLFHSFFFFFWLPFVAYGIVVPQPEIKPGPQQWKHQILTTKPPGNFPVFHSGCTDLHSHK